MVQGESSLKLYHIQKNKVTHDTEAIFTCISVIITMNDALVLVRNLGVHVDWSTWPLHCGVWQIMAA